MINTEMKDIIDYDIRKAVSDYMITNRVSKREAIYKANEIIKKLAEECKRDENPCIDCGFWDNISEGCCMPEWLHTLYDAGMNDVDITAMISIGVAQSMKFAYQDRDADMMLKLIEWSKITDEGMYNCIDKSLEKK